MRPFVKKGWRVRVWIFSTGVVASLIVFPGCTSVRNISLDHRLPAFEAPVIDLASYKPVQARGDGQDSDLAVAAAISGGGHRAANFGMGVLLALEAYESSGRPVDLLREIDYFSTVSGGGFTAGTYLSSLHDHLQAAVGKREGYSLEQALQAHQNRLLTNLERDYQGAIFETLVCLRCIGYADAGDILEHKIDKYVLGSAYRESRTSLRLGDIFRQQGDPSPVLLPYWVANATAFENGTRVPFTPDVLARYHVTGCTHNMKKLALDGNLYRMPVAVGVKASASFPVAFPATTLRCDPPQDLLNPYLHLMDGGLVDNMGYRTAIELLKQDQAPHKVLLIIDAYRGVSYPHSGTQRSPTGADAAVRITTIALDNDHGRMLANAERLARSTGPDDPPIHIVHISFASLKPVLDEQIKDIKAGMVRLQIERTEALLRRLRREITTTLNREEEKLEEAESLEVMYHDARAVATSLNITRAEQRLLIKAGRAAVAVHEEAIRKHLVDHLGKR